jgi:hypothetical protein
VRIYSGCRSRMWGVDVEQFPYGGLYVLILLMLKTSSMGQIRKCSTSSETANFLNILLFSSPPLYPPPPSTLSDQSLFDIPGVSDNLEKKLELYCAARAGII